MNNKKLIAVWFSCGAASAVAAKKTIELYGNTHDIRIINNPIKEEHEDNQRFLKDVEKWLGQKIEFAVNPNFPNQSCVEVWEKKKYMSGIKGAPCTSLLKKKARQVWEEIHRPDYTVLGFTYDEIKRHERFIQTEKPLLPVLIDLKITKDDCFKILNDQNIKLPYIYSLNFPNANCISCVKSSSVEYWKLVKTQFPEIYQHRSNQSRMISAKLIRYKGVRYFLDEIPEDAKGRKSKNNIECGIFCEEKY
jgi:hypothetical protein